MRFSRRFFSILKKRKPLKIKGLRLIGGSGGIRTLVQTKRQRAFYTFSRLLGCLTKARLSGIPLPKS